MWPQKISITSTWVGWGNYEDNLEIIQKPEGYYAQNSKLPDQHIEALLTAINAPPIPKLDLAQLDITQTWLNSNVDAALSEYQKQYKGFHPTRTQQKLFTKAFTDLKLCQKVLEQHYAGSYNWTDDYPEMHIEIVGPKDEKIVVESEAQQAFMIPWQITMATQHFKTYNSQISRTIFELLPEDFINKKRLVGPGAEFRRGRSFKYVLARIIKMEINEELDRLAVEDR